MEQTEFESEVDGQYFDEEKEYSTSSSSRWVKYFLVLSALAGGLFLAMWCVFGWLNTPSPDFPVNEPVTISTGTSVHEITNLLAAAGVVRSANLLYLQLALYHDTTDLKASMYVFDKPLTSGEVAARLTEGDFDTDLVRLTHIEGERVRTLGKRAVETLVDFDADTFIELAEPYEGMLLPETYFIPADFTEEQLLMLLREAFDEMAAANAAAIDASLLTLDETVILASIIEREANSPESMKMVSGILQNRLAIDMPLQADASIEYVLDKPLSELTPKDLEIDSPYNTYTNLGLPPTAIGNPGEEAIMAVLEPTASDYFYYITDEEGEFHYSKTYNEHLRNIERYLR